MRHHPQLISNVEKLIGSPTHASSSADETSLKAQLTAQLYRIYASVSRHREWFIIHEQNVKALAEEADALRQRFFPEEESLLLPLLPPSEDTIPTETANSRDNNHKNRTITPNPPSVTGSPFSAPQADGTHPEECWEPHSRHNLMDSDALYSPMEEHGRADDHSIHNALLRTVPAYLLQLTPNWVHERLSVNTEEVEAARVALLLPLLQSLRGVVTIAYHAMHNDNHHVSNYDNSSDRRRNDDLMLRGTARHLFYLLHETLCCFSLQSSKLRESDAEEFTTIVAQLLHTHLHEVMLQLLCQGNAEWHDPQTASAVSLSVVAEALNYLALLYMSGPNEGSSVFVT